MESKKLRKKIDGGLKTKVVLEALKGQKTTAQIGSMYGVHREYKKSCVWSANKGKALRVQPQGLWGRIRLSSRLKKKGKENEHAQDQPTIKYVIRPAVGDAAIAAASRAQRAEST